MHAVILGSDPKENAGLQKNEIRKEEKPFQGCIIRGSALWVSVAWFLGNVEFDSNYVLRDQNTECYPLVPIVWSGLPHGVIVNSLTLPGFCWNASEWDRMSLKVLQVSYRRQQRGPEQKVRTLWCSLGEVLSGFTCSTLDITARVKVNPELRKLNPGHKRCLMQF